MSFKVGDWVRFKNTPNMISKIEDFHYNGIVNTENGYQIEERFLELWQPKEGEWCWFYHAPLVDGTILEPILKKYKSDELYMSKRRKITNPDTSVLRDKIFNDDIAFYSYDLVEPFIGELPSLIKDNQ